MQIDHQADRQPCQRTGCTCKVPPGQQFCGEHCRIASSPKHSHEGQPEPCACEHNECMEHQ